MNEIMNDVEMVNDVDTEEIVDIPEEEVNTDTPVEDGEQSLAGIIGTGLGALALGALTVVVIKNKDKIKDKYAEKKEAHKAKKMAKLKAKLEALEGKADETEPLEIKETEVVDPDNLDVVDEEESEEEESEE